MTKEKQPLTAAQRKKLERKRRAWLRAGIQAAFFLLAPSMFTSAFTGIKQLFGSIGSSEPLSYSSFVGMLIALCAFTMVFGRFFCGYACAFGALGDFVNFLWGKAKGKWKALKKIPRIPEKVRRYLKYLPYGILCAIVVLTGLGVYSSFTGWSPWDVFSMLTARNFRLGSYVLGVVLLVLILIGMALEQRFFCRFLCPMGAVFRLLPVLPWAVLRRDREQCIKGCSACQKNCPVELSLGEGQNAGDCIRCGKCVGICPKGNIGSVSKLKGDELWLTGLKAVALFVLAAVLGAVRAL